MNPKEVIDEYTAIFTHILLLAKKEEKVPECIFALEEVYLSYISELMNQASTEDEFVEFLTSWLNAFLTELGLGVEMDGFKKREIH